MFDPLDVWVAGQPPSARHLNQAVNALNKLRVLFVGEGTDSTQTLGGTTQFPAEMPLARDAFWVRVEGSEQGTGIYYGRPINCSVPVQAGGADFDTDWEVGGDQIVIVNRYEGSTGSGHSLLDSPSQTDHLATWGGYTSDDPRRRIAIIQGLSFNDCDNTVDGSAVTIQVNRGAGAPATLEEGEPAVDTTNKRLYYGDGSTNFLVARAYTVTALKTGTYTAAMWELVRCDPSGGGFTVNLPTAASRGGEELVVKNATSSTNTITLDGNSSETIDGSATTTITTAWGVKHLVSDGTNWLTL